MTNEQIVSRLQAILENELAGAMMYLHYSFYIHGHARIPITGWLRSQSSEGMMHATLVGDKIAALGGNPVTRPADGKFALRFNTLDEMLRQALALEKEVFDQYVSLARELGDEQIGLRLFLESQATEETGHIEEVEAMLKPDTVGGR